MNSVSPGKKCREERSMNGMALQGFVFKKFYVRAFPYKRYIIIIMSVISAVKEISPVKAATSS